MKPRAHGRELGVTEAPGGKAYEDSREDIEAVYRSISSFF
jgi:hypothetical protein